MNAGIGLRRKAAERFRGADGRHRPRGDGGYDVGGPSVERELELWHSLDDVVRDTGCAPERKEVLLARLTEAAYRVALAHGTRGAFVDLELDLWRSLRKAMA